MAKNIGPPARTFGEPIPLFSQPGAAPPAFALLM